MRCLCILHQVVADALKLSSCRSVSPGHSDSSRVLAGPCLQSIGPTPHAYKPVAASKRVAPTAGNDDLTSELQAPSEARSWLSELGFQRVSIQGADLIALNPKPETPKPPISPHLPPKPSKPPKPPQNPQKPSKNLPKPPETQTPQNSTPKLGRCPRRSGSWSSGRRLGLQTVAAQFRGL